MEKLIILYINFF